VWHQLWSISTVSTTISASWPAGDAALAVSSAVRAPAAAAAASARLVAAVPPSCDTPITSPPLGGSSASSNAWAATTDPAPLGIPAARIASRRISTVASAACSLVPQPVTTTAAPVLAACPIAPASRPAGPWGSARRSTIRPAMCGSAAIISVM